MNLSAIRCALRRRIQRPTGMLAVALLLVVVQLAGIPRIELHAHERGDETHLDHSHTVDHDVMDHDHGPGEHPDGEPVWHFHLAAVAAAVVPAMVNPEAGLPRPAGTNVEYIESFAPNLRPAEFFRPPIA